MRALLGALVGLALAGSACAGEITTSDLDTGFLATTPSIGTTYIAVGRPGLGLPNVTNHVFDLDTRPPLGGFQIAPRSPPTDSPKYALTLIPRTADNPFKVAIAAAPGFSTYNINTGGGNNAFGVKFKLSAIGTIAPGWTLGGFASFETETEQESRRYQPSSQAGVAAFLAYEIAPSLFVGPEVRLWNSYDHALGTRPVGRRLLAGPTLLWKVSDSATFSIAYTPQISREGSRASLARQSRFNADVFDEHPVTFKLRFTF